MDASKTPTAIHGNPVEWIYEIDPPQFPSGYPGDGPLEKTRVLLLSVANSGVEERGGGYVWEPEVFAVTVLEASFDEEDAERLSRLVGVQQIAVNARRMSLEGIKKLATIPGISSLVVRTDNLTSRDVESLRTTCPDVQIIE